MNIPQEITTYIALAAALVSIVAIVFLVRSEIRISKLLRGKSAHTLEDSIFTINNELKDMGVFRTELEKYLASVESRLKRSIQGVSTLRYNPFKGTGGGGNQSFATAFLNEKGDGVIISSLYSRDHVSVFSKPVQNYKSEFELSIEEAEALELAKNTLRS